MRKAFFFIGGLFLVGVMCAAIEGQSAPRTLEWVLAGLVKQATWCFAGIGFTLWLCTGIGIWWGNTFTSTISSSWALSSFWGACGAMIGGLLWVIIVGPDAPTTQLAWAVMVFSLVLLCLAFFFKGVTLGTEEKERGG